jgi:AcrR family transcriptional regulator
MADKVERTTVQTRTPRAAGMEHMVAATLRLLQDHSPDQITVRDVADASGHHHRFVQAWFGGKVGLFRAAFEGMLQDAAGRIQRPFVPTEGFRKDLRAAVGLMNWMMAADPGALDSPRPTPIIDQIATIYREDFSLDDDVARLMALRVVGVAISAMLFAGPMGIRPGDVPALTTLELELAQLLSKARAGAD